MKRLAQLDGVRGIAILLVLVWHYLQQQIVGEPGSFGFLLRLAFGLTWSGVNLFFVLSGFLIAGILLDHRHTANYFRVFYLRRACRILPLYFLLLGLFLALSASRLGHTEAFRWLLHDPLPLWSYASFTQNILMGVRGDFGPQWLGITWSLAVEEQFYFVVPLLVYLLPRRALAGALLLAIAAAPVLRLVLPGFHAYVNTPWLADSLLSGALLAILVRHHPFVALVRRHRTVLVALLCGLITLAFALPWRPVPVPVLTHLWLAGLCSTLVLLAFLGGGSPLDRALGSPLLVWFGQLSYGIYMFHQAVSGTVHALLRQRPPQIHDLADAGITALALGLTLALAALSHRYFETPLLRLGHRFSYRPAAETAATRIP